MLAATGSQSQSHNNSIGVTIPLLLDVDPDPGRNHNTFTVDTRSSGQRWPTARRELTPDGPDSNDSFDI